jgi:hypothetical protein
VASLKSAHQQTTHYENLEEITKTEKSHCLVSNPTEAQNLNLVLKNAELRWYTIKDRHDRKKKVDVLKIPSAFLQENEHTHIYIYIYI